MVVFTGWLFASSCSPPRLSATQLLSATKGQLPFGRDFHPTVGVRSWAHWCSASRRTGFSGETPEIARGDACAPPKLQPCQHSGNVYENRSSLNWCGQRFGIVREAAWLRTRGHKVGPGHLLIVTELKEIAQRCTITDFKPELLLEKSSAFSEIYS
jgi:hypothetical protein